MRVVVNILLGVIAVIWFFGTILIIGAIACLFRPPLNLIVFVVLLGLFFNAIDPNKDLD
jgi:membrane protein implicated in regulation of membrane protease activity